MSGVRSSRKLEAACRDQIPYLWLTGWQHPDHNTLWRFYQGHRRGMRSLMKCTVGTAVEVGLVDLAIQAVDGTKVAASAAGDRTHDAAGLGRLLERTEAAIAELEAQNEGGDDPSPPRLPEQLRRADGLRGQGRAAMDRRRASPPRLDCPMTIGWPSNAPIIAPSLSVPASTSSISGPNIACWAAPVICLPGCFMRRGCSTPMAAMRKTGSRSRAAIP